MKKSMLLVLLLFPILLFPQNMSKEAQDYKDIVMKYAYNYLTPIQKDILQNHYCGPESYRTRVGGKYVPWDKEASDSKCLDEISNVVHESTHKFCRSGSLGSKKFVISETRFISVPKTDVFRSHLIVGDMLRRNPKVKDMFRFDTYVNVNSTSSMASSQDGIYGLMNEYCAYYNGALSALILYEVFKDKHSENDEEEMSFRITEKNLALKAMSEASAFYQFNSFIGAYLIYAKENYNEVYTDIINNSFLVESYSTVTESFSVIAEKTHEYFPEYAFIISSSARCGSNEELLLSQEIFNDYIDVLNEFSNSTNLLSTKK
jgi:hypothetical protein